jgi:hypothetical protein
MILNISAGTLTINDTTYDADVTGDNTISFRLSHTDIYVFHYTHDQLIQIDAYDTQGHFQDSIDLDDIDCQLIY